MAPVFSGLDQVLGLPAPAAPKQLGPGELANVTRRLSEGFADLISAPVRAAARQALPAAAIVEPAALEVDNYFRRAVRMGDDLPGPSDPAPAFVREDARRAGEAARVAARRRGASSEEAAAAASAASAQQIARWRQQAGRARAALARKAGYEDGRACQQPAAE
jgi:hypothetical protein